MRANKKVIVCVGRPGEGKTTGIKTMFPPPAWVWDKHGEYEEEGYQDFFNPKIQESIDFAYTLRDCDIIFEEASTFMSNRRGLPPQIDEMINDKRHRNINLCFVFHQIAKIPGDLLGHTDILILYKTQDVFDIVRKKFTYWEGLLDRYEKLKLSPKHSYIVYDRT